MGLISDYLEQCRDNADHLDPCLILRDSLCSHSDLQYILDSYTTCVVSQQKQLLQQELFSRLSELETLKYHTLLSEKIVLSLQNQGNFDSEWLPNTIQLLLSELRETYRGICEISQSIRVQLPDFISVPLPSLSESAIRISILHLIMSSALHYTEKDAVALSTSGFRKLVRDLSWCVKFLEQEHYNQPDKKIVLYYLEQQMGFKVGHIVCTNCGKPLLNDLPYCLNCYERN